MTNNFPKSHNACRKVTTVIYHPYVCAFAYLNSVSRNTIRETLCNEIQKLIVAVINTAGVAELVTPPTHLYVGIIYSRLIRKRMTEDVCDYK